MPFGHLSRGSCRRGFLRGLRLRQTTPLPPFSLALSDLPLSLLILRRVGGCLRGVSGFAGSGGLLNANARPVGRSAPPVGCICPLG